MTATYRQPAFSDSVRTTDDDIVVYAVRGELDSATVSQFRQGVAHVVGHRGLVIDLSTVGFIDSAGLGVIVGTVRRMRENATPVALTVCRPNLVRLLHTVGLDRVVTMCDDIVDALAFVREARTASSRSA